MRMRQHIYKITAEHSTNALRRLSVQVSIQKISAQPDNLGVRVCKVITCQILSVGDTMVQCFPLLFFSRIDHVYFRDLVRRKKVDRIEKNSSW